MDPSSSHQDQKAHQTPTSKLSSLKPTHRHDNQSTSLSSDNSPRSQGQPMFQNNISFPQLRPLGKKKQQSSVTIKQDIPVVKQQKDQGDHRHHLRHPKLISDHREFNSDSSASRKFAPRGKSLGILGRVEEDREEDLQLKVRPRKRSIMLNFVDKDEFNKEKTGLSMKDEGLVNSPMHTHSQEIQSIAEIEQSKQGLTTTVTPLTPRSSGLNLIVDQVDESQRQKEQVPCKAIESIEEQRAQDQKEQDPLRVPLMKLQQQKELMIKIIKSEVTSTDTVNLEPQNLSLVTQGCIKEEPQGPNQDQN